MFLRLTKILSNFYRLQLEDESERLLYQNGCVETIGICIGFSDSPTY